MFLQKMILVIFVQVVKETTAKDLIRERTSGDTGILAFLIGFILFLSILFLASLVSRCVWSKKGSENLSNINSITSPPRRSKSFLSNLLTIDDDDEEEGDDDDCDSEYGYYDDDYRDGYSRRRPDPKLMSEEERIEWERRRRLRIGNRTSRRIIEPNDKTSLLLFQHHNSTTTSTKGSGILSPSTSSSNNHSSSKTSSYYSSILRPSNTFPIGSASSNYSTIVDGRQSSSSRETNSSLDESAVVVSSSSNSSNSRVTAGILSSSLRHPLSSLDIHNYQQHPHNQRQEDFRLQTFSSLPTTDESSTLSSSTSILPRREDIFDNDDSYASPLSTNFYPADVDGDISKHDDNRTQTSSPSPSTLPVPTSSSHREIRLMPSHYHNHQHNFDDIYDPLMMMTSSSRSRILHSSTSTRELDEDRLTERTQLVRYKRLCVRIKNFQRYNYTKDEPPSDVSYL